MTLHTLKMKLQAGVDSIMVVLRGSPNIYRDTSFNTLDLVFAAFHSCQGILKTEKAQREQCAQRIFLCPAYEIRQLNQATASTKINVNALAYEFRAFLETRAKCQVMRGSDTVAEEWFNFLSLSSPLHLQRSLSI